MRVDRLELRAFGPFTDTVLDLSTGSHGLHVIHGSNEAGKSSALRALTAALFGVDARTTDAFVHEMKALRIGMRLRSRGGETIEFLRRKGYKRTLLDAQTEEPLDDAALRPFLGAVDRSEFVRVFGIDHVKLRDAGDALIDDADGIGDALVGAALGLGELRAVRTSLAARAEELFKSRGTKQRINAACKQFKDLGAEAKERQLLEREWREAGQALETEERREREARERVDALRERLDRLQVVANNRSRVRQLREARARLDELADLPVLPEDFEERARRAMDELDHAEPVVRSRQEGLQRATEELDAMPSEFPLLRRDPAAHQLDERAKKLRAEIAELPRGREELARLVEERAVLLADLGVEGEPDPERLARWRTALAAREGLERLAQEAADLEGRERTTRKRLDDLRRVAAPTGGEAARAADSPSTEGLGTLRRAFASAEALIAAAATRDEERREAERLEARLESLLERLAPFDGDARALQRARTPGRDEVQSFATRFGGLDEERERREKEREERERERAKLEQHLARNRESGRVPTRADLEAARDRRDEHWRRVRAEWLGEALSPAERTRPSSKLAGSSSEASAVAGADEAEETATISETGAALAARFEERVSAVDALADRMRRESDRVAQLERDGERLAELRAELAAFDAREKERAEARAALDDEWRTAWAQAGFEPGAPLAMLSWIEERERALETFDKLEPLRARLASDAARGADALRELTAALATLGTHVPRGEAESLERVRAIASDVLAQAAARTKERELEAEARKLRLEDLAKEEREAESLADERREWRARFDVAMRDLELPSEAGTEEARARLTYIEAFFAADDASAQRRRRNEDLVARLDALERQARELAALEASPLAGVSLAESGADELERARALEVFAARAFERREEEARQEARRDAAAQRLEEAEQALADARSARDELELALASLAREAGESERSGLEALLPRLVERRAAATRRDERMKEIEEVGRHSVERVESWVDAVEAEGVDVERERERLDRELKAADDELAEARDAFTRAKSELDSLRARAGSAEVTERQCAIAAELSEDVTEYLRLRLADHLLARSIERFRDRNETPMLEFASRYLRDLTGGRYERIETDLDDKDKPYFQLREVGQTGGKGVLELSDGTRDQLHLALVLASLERRALGGVEPVPLVLDDVLVHFDDERSLAALRVLAEFSRETQVLLFTHHGRIREQAASIGEDGGAFVHELKG